MQSDKLPKMPLNDYELTEVSRMHPQETITKPLFTYQQMRDYGAASREVALSECIDLLRAVYNKMESDKYLYSEEWTFAAGHVMDEASGLITAIEKLMEQDA